VGSRLFFKDIVDEERFKLYCEESNTASFNLTSGNPKYPIVVAVPEEGTGLKLGLLCILKIFEA
jgi:hypothetical protein